MRSEDMFTKIGVQNFGQFKDKVEFDIKPITIFTGPNNSGKSTLNKLIVFLSQCFDIGFHEIPGAYFKDLENISLDEQTIREIGDIKENLNIESNDKTMNFYFTFDDSKTDDEIEVNLAYSLCDKSISDSSANKQKAALTKILISINHNPVIHLSKEDMYQHFENKKVFKYIYDSSSPFHKKTKKLIPSSRLNDSDKLVWVSKHDDDFSNILREYLISYRDCREGQEKRKEINTRSNSEPILNSVYEKTDIHLQTKNKELLIHSHFCDTILSDKDFFDTPKKPQDSSIYRDELTKVKIKNRDEFIETYIDFETELIKAIYNDYFNSINKTTSLKDVNISEEFPDALENIGSDIGIYDHDKVRELLINDDEFPPEFLKELNDYSVIETKKIKNIIPYHEESKLSEQEIICLLRSIKNPLTDMFINELEENNKLDDDTIDVNYFNTTYINTIYKLIFEDIINGFLSVFERKFVNNILGNSEIFKQNALIQPRYFFDNQYQGSSHMLELGKRIKYYNQIEDKKFLTNNPNTIYQMDFINKWVKEFEIADELIISPIKDYDNIIGFSYYIKKGELISPLVNEGYGVTKLISIIIYIMMSGGHSHIILEEPEANLHPSFQSKLADLFADEINKERASTYKRDSIIIETHSEYLIKKFQYLVANEEINKDEIVIYYFNSNENVNEREKKVKEIRIDQTGGLTDTFGPGFFDETTSLQFELYKLNQSKNN